MNLRLTPAAVLVAVAALALAPTASPAQSTADVVGDGGAVAGSATSMLRDALLARKAERDAAARRAAAANQTAAAGQPTPFPNSFETPRPGFLHPSAPGINYSLDISSAFPYGDIGFKRNSLPGGIDGTIYAAPDKYTRFVGGYYQLQDYPIGFDTGVVPSYVLNSTIPVIGPTLPGVRTRCNLLAGIGPPVPPVLCDANGNANLYLAQNDASVKNRIWVLSLQKLFYIGGIFPFVVSPTYISRQGSVGGGDDNFVVWDESNQNFQTVHLRTVQTKGVYLTVPFASSKKLFATYTIGPQWLMNTNGLQQTNHPQIFQLLDIRYFANDKTTIFLQPSRLQNYLPNDPYPQRIPTIIAGFNYKFAKPFFIQAFVASGTPVNPPNGDTGRIGVIDVTCINLATCLSSPSPRSNTALGLGGLKATQFLLQFGIGTPTVIPL